MTSARVSRMPQHCQPSAQHRPLARPFWGPHTLRPFRGSAPRGYKSAEFRMGRKCQRERTCDKASGRRRAMGCKVATDHVNDYRHCSRVDGGLPKDEPWLEIKYQVYEMERCFNFLYLLQRCTSTSQ